MLSSRSSWDPCSLGSLPGLVGPPPKVRAPLIVPPPAPKAALQGEKIAVDELTGAGNPLAAAVELAGGGSICANHGERLGP